MTYVTLGGVTVGVCLLVWTLVQWYPGAKLRKDPLRVLARLLPFGLGWIYGVLAILTVGGIVGWIARGALWISNWLGDVALVWGVGGDPGAHASGHAFLPLTQTGTAVVLILTAAMVAAVKKSTHGPELKRGALCGVCLGTSAGVAGFAAVPLAQAVNVLGGFVYGAVA
ncbi:hypothetical protein [Streptomyces sp. SPB074]|uniref:hypothetical protein n=1 Tax=Streptomyces sp. (strain SPB074) TaxID=465543 RepID=UPI00017F25F3|nr:hypothetical protein [Streptomyces sp. SPB074]EDY44601.1 hypothetical protein SSBG_02563 [Streptomyces sp. SPB074]